jgi:hypothetical protein
MTRHLISFHTEKKQGALLFCCQCGPAKTIKPGKERGKAVGKNPYQLYNHTKGIAAHRDNFDLMDQQSNKFNSITSYN